MDQKISESVEQITQSLLDKIGIAAKIQTTTDESGTIYVKLETEETGLLIGYHGETLYSLQLIVGLMVFHKVGTWNRIIFEVGDYRERREEQLVQMAQSLAQRVKQTGESMSMPYLTSGERRIVHLVLENDKEIESQSEGEGENRRLIIKPKTMANSPSTPEPQSTS